MTINVNNRSNTNISFRAGKIKLFSDFDGTYCNFSHLSICRDQILLKDKQKQNYFKSFYDKFDAFQKKAGSNLEFTITTGRNREEFNYFIGKIHEQGQKISLPQKIIVCDGSDIFKSHNNIFFSQDYYEKTKRADIFKFSNGWDGKRIKKDLKNIVLEFCRSKINIIDVPVNKHEHDYGEISLEYILKSASNDIKQNFVSFRDDGDLSFHITGSHSVPFEHISKGFEEYFQKNNIGAQVSLNENDYNAIIPIFNNNNFAGLSSAKSITVRPVIKSRVYSGVLNKLYDTRKVVKEIIDKKSNDLVIIAGDDSNDFKALNPLSYVDLLGLPKPPQEPDKEIEYIQKYKKKIQQLPIVSIVAGKRNNLDRIRQMTDYLNDSNARKIICIDNEQITLAEGIEEGVKDYSKQNAKFNKHLPDSLKLHMEQEDKSIILKLKDFIRRSRSGEKIA